LVVPGIGAIHGFCANSHASKRLGLNLVSEQAEGGRIYRIVAAPTARAKQAA